MSRLLGHANPTVTQNIYGDPSREELRKAGEKLKIDIMPKGQQWCNMANKAIWQMIFGYDTAKLCIRGVPGWRNWQTHRT